MMTNRETAMLKAPDHYTTRKLDFDEGDIVQVKRHDKYGGRIGRIIGITYSPLKRAFLYTIKFNDKESVSILAHFISFLSKKEESGHDEEATDSDEIESGDVVNR